jgi:hypothetical protein
MSKFLYAFLFLVAVFFTSPGHTMDDEYEWFVESRYEYKGTVFPTTVCDFKKEKNRRTGSIRHSPKETGAVTPATVKFISKNAVLHFKYYEMRTADASFFSFYVTPNPTELTETSEDLTSLPTTCYGSIPIDIKNIKNMVLLIVENDEAVGQGDYATTMAEALEIILSQYIPSIRGRLPSLETVTINNRNESIAATLLGKVSRGISSFKLQSYRSVDTPPPFWSMIFRINDQ